MQMAFENKICIQCESFRLVLLEREKEINKLKLHIKNLTNYLLWKDNSPDSVTDINEKTKYDLNMINEAEDHEQKFYSSELFITTYNILNNCILQESKSTQTDNIENCNTFNDTVDGNKASESAENSKDYVYDKNYQMYYNLSTGYYYDQNSGLMYEPQSRIYYRYNYDKSEYEKVPVEESSNIDQGGSVILKNNEEINYSCERVVHEVNNLNLNDDSTKLNKSHKKIEDTNILKCENSANGSNNGNCDIDNLEISEESVSLGCAQEWQLAEGSKLTVTDIVKQVVDEHNNMSDYIYDETSQMYYSPSTGYFYDAERNLLYDPTSGIYYFYNADKQTYEFYCQTEVKVDDDSNTRLKQNSIDKERLTCRKLYWKKKLASETFDNEVKSNTKDSEDLEEFSSPEDGEIFSSDDDEDDLNSPVCIVKSPIKGPCLKLKSTDESYPPSIRAIVETSENLQIGSLLLITCSGGIIGRDKMNAIYIPDLCVSKVHAEIKYNSKFQTYSIEDLGSQNGTFINEKRLSEPKIKSEPCTLNHGDKLSLGSCKLLLHIHDGHETCDNCEPGQVLAEISSKSEKNVTFLSKEEKEKLRREELRKLKQKYGLQRSYFETRTTSLICKGYEDKSEIRRQTVGSDNPYEKTQEASLDVSMPETNKGYQMLKKMGWKEGQTLGATDCGLVEPIPLRPWTSKAGFGSPYDAPSSTKSLPEDRRTQKWVKAQERYFQLSLRSTDPAASQEEATTIPLHQEPSLPT